MLRVSAVIWLGPDSWNVVYAGYGRAASSSPIRIRITASFSYHPATSCLLEASVSITDACWKRLKAMASLLGGGCTITVPRELDLGPLSRSVEVS